MAGKKAAQSAKPKIPHGTPPPAGVGRGGTGDRRRVFMVGVTGGLAMGKSTVKRMVAEEREAVFDADEAVHQLYESGKAADLVEREFPGVTEGEKGRINRGELAKRVVGDDDALRRLEAIVHPLVLEQRREFVNQCEKEGRNLCFLEVPLLFETGAQRELDEVVVVSTEDESLQRRRALSRPGMTPEKVDAILKRQLPDDERRRMADHVVNTKQRVDKTRERVRHLLTLLRQKAASFAPW